MRAFRYRALYVKEDISALGFFTIKQFIYTKSPAEAGLVG
ncbi:hypothetical protein BOCO_0724 [Bombiscardovia coagulans]|uniref:Uncharacterized protein n=1 Tax=Bombiscardovia coagulans TaxID=686666 RepID=A0A261ETM9_9BIFI|nr:hypothetical protein BOCO_0724 [Bombiscardovia coagulans]